MKKDSLVIVDCAVFRFNGGGETDAFSSFRFVPFSASVMADRTYWRQICGRVKNATIAVLRGCDNFIKVERETTTCCTLRERGHETGTTSHDST